jgi:hypothetical protein
MRRRVLRLVGNSIRETRQHRKCSGGPTEQGIQVVDDAIGSRLVTELAVEEPRPPERATVGKSQPRGLVTRPSVAGWHPKNHLGWSFRCEIMMVSLPSTVGVVQRGGLGSRRSWTPPTACSTDDLTALRLLGSGGYCHHYRFANWR